jgi:hypothetical protein
MFDYNITHNLNTMADHAGIYKFLWRPEEVGVTKAKQLIVPLSIGLHVLKENKMDFKKFEPDNGWGNIDNLIQFTAEYLAACIEHPTATIHVSR